MINSDGLEGSLQENCLVLILFFDSASIVRATVDVSLFTSRAYRDIVTRAYSFIDQHKKAPKNAHIGDLLEDLLKQKNEHSKHIEEVLWKAQTILPGFNERFALDQLDKFVRQQSMKIGFVKAYELMQRNDFDGAEIEFLKAVKRRDTTFTPGLTLKQVIKELSNPNEQRDILQFGIKELDRLKLGPGKQELHLFIAPPKGGKSWFLTHCTKRALRQQWKVVYITLELADKFVGRRMLQSLFALKTRDDAEVSHTKFIIGDNKKLESIESKIKERPSIENLENIPPLAARIDELYLEGKLLIKQYATGTLTVPMIGAYLDQLDTQYSFIPDLLVVDYADLMKIDSKNYRLDLGILYKDLRGLAVERNLALVTASQSTREGSKARTIEGSDVAEDYSKIATADCVLTYSATKQERRRGLARLFVAAGRVEADRFSVAISQSYASGQFVLDSWYLGYEYWEYLKREDAEEENEDT